MRVVYLNPCGQMGGAETSLRELLRAVRLAEPEWDLYLVLAEDGPLAKIAGQLGVRVILLPFPSSLARVGDSGHGLAQVSWSLMKAALRTVGYARKLRRVLREIKPDIIHTNGLKMHLLGSWSCPSSARLLWHIHDYVGARRFMSRLLRLSSKPCAAAIANSRSVAADLGTLFKSLKIRTIYNAVDLARFAPHGARLDLDAMSSLPPAPGGTVRVGLVATYARWKGHTVFLDALARLPLSAPVRGYIIGGPIYQTQGSQWTVLELHKECDRLGLAGKVGFTGFVEDNAAAIRSLDIVIHASTEPEPFGMVIVEGMACGKAVIASPAGGASELFLDGVSALSHSPGDAAALACQINRLACDPDLRRRIGAEARQAAEQHYSGSRLAEQLLALYREVRGEQPIRTANALASSLS